MRHLALLILVALIPRAIACSREDGTATTRVPFKAQLDEEWKFWMEQYPEMAFHDVVLSEGGAPP